VNAVFFEEKDFILWLPYQGRRQCSGIFETKDKSDPVQLPGKIVFQETFERRPPNPCWTFRVS